MIKEKKKVVSLFENELQNLSIPKMAIFGTESAIKVPFFRKNPTLASFSSGQEAEFKQIDDAGHTAILEADDTQLDTKHVQRIAVLFSGGPAAGGHNVVAGLKAMLPEPHVLFGVKAGPKGLLAGDLFELSIELVQQKANLGGFDLLGSDRTKIKSDAQFEQVEAVVKRFKLTGLVVVGGDDSNTNALFLADRLLPLGCKVIGVPKTIDGDLQLGAYLPISFGFDTACKVYAELVGNILQDTPSSRKYWHFVKLMGRSASHIALEVALKTQAQYCVISEAVLKEGLTLADLATRIADVIRQRHDAGKNYGVVLIPEGLIEFIPEFRRLISHLNRVMGRLESQCKGLDAQARLTLFQSELDADDVALLNSLPSEVRACLMMDRDSHGNVQVSQIPTELLLIHAVKAALGETLPCHTNQHFFGYEGRCAAPSRFDAAFTFNLGLCAAALLLNEKSGYMAAISDLNSGGKAYGLPLAAMVQKEARGDAEVMVIEKALVDLESPAYLAWQALQAERDVTQDDFLHPGPIQFFGPECLTHSLPKTVCLNQGYSDEHFSF